MTKQELRKLYLQKRASLGDQDMAGLSQRLSDMFFKEIDLSSVNVLHIFLPIVKSKEPNTWLIIDRLQKEFPDIKLSLPKINIHTSGLESIYYEGRHQLKENSWGILEPQEGISTDSKKIDMVLVPLLVFDMTGHRVGYGKGFYDRLLAMSRRDCKKIGISLFPPVDKIDDVTSHDQQLDIVITPETSFGRPHLGPLQKRG